MIHDKNDVLTDDELVVAIKFFKKSKMRVCTCAMNFFVDLGC